ncbi:MAG: NUDIX hydrolase [Microgenomates group bacterium]
MREQQLILVDEKDNFLGKYAPKNRCHTGEGLHHRAFTIMIVNKKGEVLLQKRKHKLWDGYWDLTNSHPLHLKGADETYEQAASRCLKKEWGVEFPVKMLFGFNYFAQYGSFCENEYCAFLKGKYEGKVYPSQKVAYGYKWMDLKILLKDIKIHPKIYTPWAVKALGEYEKRFIR